MRDVPPSELTGPIEPLIPGVPPQPEPPPPEPEPAGPTMPPMRPLSSEALAQWPEAPPTGLVERVQLDVLPARLGGFHHLTVPRRYTRAAEWPVVVVLHGEHRQGPDQVLKYFEPVLDKHGAIGVYPKVLKTEPHAWNAPHEIAYVMHIIRQVGDTYRIDPRRVYVVGYWMGGQGAWVQGAVLGNMLAGFGSIAGDFEFEGWPGDDWFKGKAVYFIHGDKDEQASRKKAQDAYKRASKGNKERRRFVELKGVRHMVLNTKKGREALDEMIAFLLAHPRRDSPKLEDVVGPLANWGKQYFWEPEGSPLGRYDHRYRR